MSTFELLDELEAGELSIQYEGEEPQALLEWAIAEFSPRLAISAAFQADDVALILARSESISSCVSFGSRPVSTVKIRTAGSILYAMSMSATSSAWNAAEIARRGLNSSIAHSSSA